MNLTRAIALGSAFVATSALAQVIHTPALAQTVPMQVPPVASVAPRFGGENFFLVINNTRQPQLCSSRAPDGQWQPWFEVQSAANWEGTSASKKIFFQCRPPVAQVSYPLKPGTRYSLLPDGNGVKLIEVVPTHTNR